LKETDSVNGNGVHLSVTNHALTLRLITWAKLDLSLAFKKKLEMGFSERVGEGGQLNELIEAACDAAQPSLRRFLTGFFHRA
jgi:hypothetical protein